MSSKIVGVNIKDYRAFLGHNNVIILPNGENLLMYGENGSGKTSLFRAMDDFLTSSSGTVNLTENANMFREGGLQPSVSLDFKDLTTQESRSYFINEVEGTSFIEKANLSKAFFGYSDIQTVHHTERIEKGHFYALLEILKDYIYRPKDIFLKVLWDEIEVESKNRQASRITARIDNLLLSFNAAMEEIKGNLTPEMRKILRYFNEDIDIELEYIKATFDKGRKKAERLQPPNIRIRVSYFNRTLPDAYPKILNEARLSSLALSLYLASLLTRPSGASEYKILFLDDALIGLDNGNRIPLLKVLHDLFGDYQIFLTTYDRYWYEMAKDWFEKEALIQPTASPWAYYEMYSVKEPEGRFEFPVILPADSFIGKANRHMNNPVYPDYAAAANNFRKAAEEILLKGLPEHLLKDSEGENPQLMLKDLLVRCDNFLTIIEQPKTYTTELAKYLRILLNPLSHYNPETPIYKGELMQIEPVLVALQSQLRTLKDEGVYRVLGVPGERTLRFRFQSESGEVSFYLLELKGYWYRYVKSEDQVEVNNVKVTRVQISYRGSEKNDVQNHDSLSDAFASITTHLVKKRDIAPLPEGAHYKDVLEVFQDGTWKSYNEIITFTP